MPDHLAGNDRSETAAPKRCKVGHPESIRGCRYCAALFVAHVAERLGVEPPEKIRRLLRD